MSTRLLQCNCENEFQNKTYGRNIRVFNFNENGSKSVKDYKCTVCNSIIRK